MSFRNKLNLLGYLLSSLILLGCSAIPSDHEWHGNWFPKPPSEPDPYLDVENAIDSSKSYTGSKKTMGIQDSDCDDAERNIWIDYDHKNVSHHKRFLCLQNRKMFEPNVTVEPIVREYTIPVEYSALHRCMNESIDYDYDIPTFGAHRPLWPVYGEYTYVPVQRWAHNLEHGAIVALHHPCVNKRQLNDFRTIVKNCLYRHIITPYEKLKPERPFALVAWGRNLEMSVADRELVVGFIRMSAIQGPEKVSRNGQYNSGISELAKTVSDIDDRNICPNM